MTGKSILVTWETQDTVVPEANSIDHFGIKLATTNGAGVADDSEPLDSRSHTFLGVEPGDYVVTCQSYNSDETVSSAPPMSAPVTVDAEAQAPVVVTLTASAATPPGNVVNPLG